ncbi:zinc-dependent metalloprotease [Kocuria sp. LUK]|uniref:zinc-dependent metalloprotease n=1 Tax=Kocuria sp. LUK TaxID=2897828 RepID=UPI001E2D096C|nr:zinc-dependent metalloprotease [Kocuria sp. LUK]MCD1145755.1 zinc-dependent metalloprotease [Kocuria sp. LUK]
MTSQPPHDPSGDDDGRKDPFQEMLERLLGGSGMNPEDLRRAGVPMDPQTMSMMFQQIQSMMGGAGTEGPVNWKLAHDHARRIAAADGDPSVTAAQRGAVEDAMKLAELWLGEHTAFDPTAVRPQAWSRAEWIEATMPTWQEMTGPVAGSVTQALTDALTQQLPAELTAMMGGATGMLAGAGGMLFGMQLGQAIGGLSREVLCSTDIGLPLAEGRSALLPASIKEFGEGLDLPAQEIMLYLAVREAAHVRLFTANPWLRGHVLDLVRRFSEGIHIDMARIEEAARDIDPMDPSSMQEALSSGIFAPQQTPDQEVTLKRLETVLALVEGWVHVVTAESTANLPSAGALSETIRRRRASGGPAEHAFGALVGLELRPRRLREAAEFWRHVGGQRGVGERDRLWDAPELLPTDEDLDDPAGFTARRGLLTASEDEVDAALQKLLSGDYDDPDGSGPSGAEDGPQDGGGSR